jgi:hypothetical protein
VAAALEAAAGAMEVAEARAEQAVAAGEAEVSERTAAIRAQLNETISAVALLQDRIATQEHRIAMQDHLLRAQTRPAPAAAEVAAAIRRVAEVNRLYGKYNPEKLVDVASLVEKYGDKKLLGMVQKKYKKQEMATPAVTPAAVRGGHNVIFPRPILVYSYRGRKCQCKMTLWPPRRRQPRPCRRPGCSLTRRRC